MHIDLDTFELPRGLRNTLEWNKNFIYTGTRGLIPSPALYLPIDIWGKARKEFTYLSIVEKSRDETLKKSI